MKDISPHQEIENYEFSGVVSSINVHYFPDTD